MGRFDPAMSLFGAELQTTDSIQALLKGSDMHRRDRLKTVPRLYCADGFSLSAQASDFHRCEPRSLEGPYISVECGLLSRPEPRLMPYLLHEEGIPPEEGTYNYVPTAILVEIINEHGGLIL